MLAACNFHKGADDIAQEGKRFIDVSRFLCRGANVGKQRLSTDQDDWQRYGGRWVRTLSCSPFVCESFCLSEPARSIRFSREYLVCTTPFFSSCT